ncbi:type II toxin-antitoxin system RelE/ParE family toxin [Streptomyces sp. YS-3]|uniref:type II toxin-antitoxin system RelE/ParE family toxin n=1 Tax=Streptomyces sp. YS-3 TaxID=3381352 RepID=UPI003862A5DC
MTCTVVWEARAMDEFRRLRRADPVGAKACAAAVRELGSAPRPAAARALGGSGYHRLPVGAWRVLYRLEEATLSVHVVKVGRVS